MLGTCADPPSLGDSLPLHKAGELGCAFLPLLGYRPHAVVPYARECIETFVSDPPPPSDTPEYLARLVPVERTCDASVDTHRGDAATTPDDTVSRADPHVGTQNVSLF